MPDREYLVAEPVKPVEALKQEQGYLYCIRIFNRIHQPIQTLSSHVLLRSFSQIFYILPNYSWLIIMNIMIFFSRGGIWNTKSRKRLALCVCFCFVLWCNTLPGTQKIFYPCDDPISFWRMLPRDLGKFGDWFAWLPIVCIVSDD